MPLLSIMYNLDQKVSNFLVSRSLYIQKIIEDPRKLLFLQVISILITFEIKTEIVYIHVCVCLYAHKLKYQNRNCIHADTNSLK